MVKNIEALKAINQWISYSGIQSEDGGFYAWFDMDKKEFSFLYSEITGYGITTLLFLYKISGNKRYIENAKKAADWIINCAMHPSGGVRTRLYKSGQVNDPAYSFENERIFSFDTGMVLYGIASLYRVTKEKKYIDTLKKIADFLVHSMQDKEGWFIPIYNGKAGSTEESFDKWSNQRGSYHAKIALGLVCLYEITRNKTYRQSAEGICIAALRKQDQSGRFITNSIDNTTHLHPHCYSIEGLLYVGISLNIPELIKASMKAAQWMLQYVHDNGLHELYRPGTEDFNEVQRSDILAQALRLSVYFDFCDEAEKLKNTLLSYQYSGCEAGQAGGFFYTMGDRHVNSWCTMFSLQALAMYHSKALASEDSRTDLFI